MKVIFGLFLSIFSLQVVAAAIPDDEIEDFLRLPTGTLDSISTGNATEGSAIKGSFDVNVGDTFGFDFVWDSKELSDDNYNDFAFFSLSLDGVGVLADTSTPDNYAGSFIWTADESGQLDFGIGIMDVNDMVVDSFLYVSNLSANYGPITGIGSFVPHGDGGFEINTVPLPASIWLFLTGIAFVMAKGKNRSTSRA